MPSARLSLSVIHIIPDFMPTWLAICRIPLKKGGYVLYTFCFLHGGTALVSWGPNNDRESTIDLVTMDTDINISLNNASTLTSAAMYMIKV